MTLKEFFNRLPTDGWFLFSGILWRRINDNDACDGWDCPITAALSPRSGRGSMKKVATAHQLDFSLTWAIAHAADNSCRTPTERRIRRLLLKHCGLTEPTA